MRYSVLLIFFIPVWLRCAIYSLQFVIYVGPIIYVERKADFRADEIELFLPKIRICCVFQIRSNPGKIEGDCIAIYGELRV